MGGARSERRAEWVELYQRGEQSGGARPERRVGRDRYKDLTLSEHGVLCVLILKLLMFYYSTTF